MDIEKLPKKCTLCNSKDVKIRDYLKRDELEYFVSTCQVCYHEDLIITREISPS